MTVALVSCPCFAFGSPPLAMASLQAALRGAGLETTPWDLDFLFMRHDPATFEALYRVFSIARPAAIDRVQYVIRPELLLMALFESEFDGAVLAANAEDLAVIRRARQWLSTWAGYIVAEQPGCVLVSSYVSTLPACLLLCQAIKALDPSLPIAIGGPGVGLPAIQEWVLRLGMVDACAAGEGEVVAPALARGLQAGTPGEVPGISYLVDDMIVSNPAPPLIAMSELRTPDFEGFPAPGHSLASYRSNPLANTRWFGAALPIATTRGCVMRCSFCSETNYWQRFRYRDPDAVLDEISELVERWGVRQFLFGDSLLNGSLKWLEAFADRCIERELGVTFLFAYMRPTRLSRETLDKLVRAGFRLISFGLETGSQAQLDAMKKGTKVEEAEQVVLDALDAGISVNISVLCGFPEETTEQVMESVRFVQRVRRQIVQRAGPEAEVRLTVHSGAPLRVEPSSGMYNDPVGAGIVIHEVPVSLPLGLAHLEPATAPLVQRWTSSVALDEIRARSELLMGLNIEPRTVFLEHDLGAWITDDTLLYPTRAAQVLRSDDGSHFLAGAGQLLAQLDDVGAAAWPLFASGMTFAAVRDAISADHAHLTQIAVTLLQMRLVYVGNL